MTPGQTMQSDPLDFAAIELTPEQASKRKSP